MASSAANGSSISSRPALLAERAGERHALAHAAGELVDALVVDALEMHRSSSASASAGVPCGARPQLQRELSCARREPREEGGLLEHQRGTPPDLDRPDDGLVETGDEVQQRRLTATEAPSRQTNSPGHVQVDAIESLGGPGPVPKISTRGRRPPRTAEPAARAGRRRLSELLLGLGLAHDGPSYRGLPGVGQDELRRRGRRSRRGRPGRAARRPPPLVADSWSDEAIGSYVNARLGHAASITC